MTSLSGTTACRVSATAYFVAALLIALPLASAGQGEEGSDPQTLSVCDILRDPTKYSGKMIAVRGYLSGGPEGSALMGDCEKRLTTIQGFVWPNMIWLAGPSDALRPVSFSPDYEALSRTRLTLARKIKDRKLDRIWETYIGQFETWGNINSAVYTDLNGGQHLAGFGSSGNAPGQLIVKTVKDATVEHLEKPNQNPDRN